MKAAKLLFSFLWIAVGVTGAETTLVPAGEETIWRYLDGKAVPGAKWNAPGFDDSGWKKGKAPLGYGKEDVKTNIVFGDDAEKKPLTAYFRTTFQGPPKEEKGFKELGLMLSYDDGVAVYLNGKEVARGNLEEGPLTPESAAIRAVRESGQMVTTIPADALKYGAVNTVAVEVHQAGPTSSELYLDLKLSGLREG